MLCLRAFALRPRIVERIRAAGVTTLVWFPDDPVLYKVGYRHVVEAYDIASALRARRGTRVLRAPARRHRGQLPVLDGHDGVPVRARPGRGRRTTRSSSAARWATCAPAATACSPSLPAEVRVQGQVETTPRASPAPSCATTGKSSRRWPRPRRHQPRPALRRLPRPRVRLPGARRPWLVRAARAAWSSTRPRGCRSSRSIRRERRTRCPRWWSRTTATTWPRAWSGCWPIPTGCGELGLRTRERFERRLSAERRAELLEALLRIPEGWRALSIAERATLWRGDDPEPEDRRPRRAGDCRLPRPAAPAVVVAGYYGAATRATS